MFLISKTSVLIAVPKIAAKTKTIPPIVGVPFLTLCDANPSSRSTWPNFILCRNGITLGIAIKTKTNPTPKAKINFKKFSIFLTPFFKFVFTIPYYRIIGKIKGTKSQLFDIFIDKYLILSLIQLPF